MAFPLFNSAPSAILRLGLGLGIGVSAATLHPLSPFRSPIQCQYTAPYYRPETPANADSGWAVKPNDPALSKQGQTGIGARAQSGFLTADNMRQVSLGSVLGLVAGVGLRAFSRVLVVVLGMGVVLVEVWFLPLSAFSGCYVRAVALMPGTVGIGKGVQHPPARSVAKIGQGGQSTPGHPRASTIQAELRCRHGACGIWPVLDSKGCTLNGFHDTLNLRYGRRLLRLPDIHANMVNNVFRTGVS